MYTINYRPGQEYLRADVCGNLAEPQTRIAAWTEIIDRCREDDVTHLLVVQDSPGNGTAINAFISSDGIVGLGLSGIKIAFVDLDPQNHEINKFGEMVALNRGANARVFFDEALAVDWLLKHS